MPGGAVWMVDVGDGLGVGVGAGPGAVAGEGVGAGDGLGVFAGVGERVGDGDGEGAGGLVSTLKVKVLFSSAPSVLALPAVSVKVPLATEITPLVVLLLLGVKVAV